MRLRSTAAARKARFATATRRRSAAVLVMGLLTAAGATADPGAEAGDAERGRAVFATYCVSCHGSSGEGDGPVGRWLDPPLRPLSAATYRIDADGDGRRGTREDLRRLLVDGAAAYGGSRLMAPFPQLAHSPGDLADLLAYLEAPTRR